MRSDRQHGWALWVVDVQYRYSSSDDTSNIGFSRTISNAMVSFAMWHATLLEHA